MPQSGYCGYESYAPILWAAHLGTKNVWGPGNKDYEQYNETFTTCGRIGSSSDFISPILGQYNHFGPPGSDFQYQKIDQQVLNYKNGRWTGTPSWLYFLNGYYFRNKCVGWQRLEVNSRSTVLIGSVGSRRKAWDCVLLQFAPDGKYWLVKGENTGVTFGAAPGGFNSIVNPDMTRSLGLNIGDYPGSGFGSETYFCTRFGSNPGYDESSVANQIYPKAYTLPAPKSKFRTIDIIQSWGFATSTPQKTFSGSGEGGVCINNASGNHIILVDGVEIARIPFVGLMDPTPNVNYVTPRPTNLVTIPSFLRLPEFYDATGTPIGIRNASNWLLNYEQNWYEGDNWNTEGPTYEPNLTHDQKVVSPTGLSGTCYDFDCASGANLTTLGAGYDRDNPFKIYPYLKVGGNEWEGNYGDFVTFGSFPVYGAKFGRIGFTWDEAPYGKLWVIIGIQNRSVVMPGAPFNPSQYIKLAYVNQQDSHDITNKEWVFTDADLCRAERWTSGSPTVATSLTSLEQDALDNLYNASGEFRVTINF
jgi:hypothetical protein